MRNYRFLLTAALAVATVTAAFIGATATSETAWAKTRPIKYVTAASLKATCDSVGGTFHQQNNGHHCAKVCGGGNVCGVDCDKKKKTCSGRTPSRTAGGTIQDILRGGNYSDRRNVKTMTNNAGDFARQPAGARMINNSGTFQAGGRSAAVGIPTTGVPSLAMPGGSSPSQGTLHMKKR